MEKVRTPNVQLRECREQHRLTQAALAEKLGVSTLTVGRWERGEAFPTPYALRKLCTLLEATPQELGFSPAVEEVEGASSRGGEEQAPERSSPFLSRRVLLASALAGGVAVGGSALLFMHRAGASTSARSPRRPVLQTLKPSLVYTGHVKRVESVAWHPSDAYLASASADGIVRVWHSQRGDDLSSSQCISGIIYWVAWSPDGSRLALAGDDRTVRIIPVSPSGLLAPGPYLPAYDGHQGAVYACAWSPDGRWIASGGQDGTLRAWSIDSKRLHFAPPRVASPISTVAWSPDGRYLLAGSDDWRIYRYDASTGTLLTTYTGHTGPINAVAWSPSSQQFASTSDDGTARVWDAATSNVKHLYQFNQGEMDAVAWTADGRYLACGGVDKLAHIWDAKTTEQISTGAGNTAKINVLAWSHRGYRLASAGQDKSVQIWNLSAIPR